jgi:hypothetical protein
MIAAELDAVESDTPAVFVKRYCDRRNLPLVAFHVPVTELFHQLRVELGFEERATP